MGGEKIGSLLITGANRPNGIAFEFVRQFSLLPNPPNVIFATCRSPDSAKDLQALKAATKTTKIVIVQYDATDKSQAQLDRIVSTVEAEVGPAGLNLLINNAAIYNLIDVHLADQTYEDLVAHFEVNCVAPLMLTRALLPLLKRAAAKNLSGGHMSVARAAVINISSDSGSLSLDWPESYQYKISKAAHNMATKTLSIDLKQEGILVMPLHPGWIKTDMSGQTGKCLAPDVVIPMVKLLQNLTESNHGQFLDFRGDVVPW